MLFGKKNDGAAPEEHGPHSIHPKSKLPPKMPERPAEVVPAPKPKPVLSPGELEELRKAKFKQLQIPYEQVIKAEAFLATVRPNLKKFDPDMIEKDWKDINHRLESYDFGFQITTLELFNHLMTMLQMTEQQAATVNSISESVGHLDLIINMIIWCRLEQRIRRDKKITPDIKVPETEIIAAGKTFWQNAERKIIWKQAERRLRHQRNLPANAELSKEDIEKMYQELMLHKQQHQQVAPTQTKPANS